MYIDLNVQHQKPLYFSFKMEYGVFGAIGQTVPPTELKNEPVYATIPHRSLEDEIASEMTPLRQVVLSFPSVKVSTILYIGGPRYLRTF